MDILPSFAQLTLEYVGSPESSSQFKSVNELKIGCQGALHQWQGYMSGTIEWVSSTCGNFEMLNSPQMPITLHGQLATAAQKQNDFTTAYVLDINHLHDHQKLLTQTDQFLAPCTDALNLAASKLPQSYHRHYIY